MVSGIGTRLPRFIFSILRVLNYIVALSQVFLK